MGGIKNSYKVSYINIKGEKDFIILWGTTISEIVDKFTEKEFRVFNGIEFHYSEYAITSINLYERVYI